MTIISNKFPSSALISFENVVPLFVTGSMFLIGILDFLTSGRVVGTSTISILLLPFLPLFVLIRLTSRIKFQDNYVEKITIFSTNRIKLDAVKSFGVWIQYGRFAPVIVDPREVDEYSLLAVNVIFISTEARINPISPSKREMISFQYRKDVYDYVGTVLSQRCPQCKPHK